MPCCFAHQSFGPITGRCPSQLSTGRHSHTAEIEAVGAGDQHQQSVCPRVPFVVHPAHIARVPQSDPSFHPSIVSRVESSSPASRTLRAFLPVQLFGPLSIHGQLSATLLSSRFDHPPPARCGHTGAEAVCAHTLALFWLIRSFWHSNLLIQTVSS